MKTKLLLTNIILAVLMSGCATVKNFDPVDATKQVNERAGYIQVATSGIVQIAIYAGVQDKDEQLKIKSQMRVVAANLRTLAERGEVDPASVTDALKIKEDIVDGILTGVATLYRAEFERAQQNGYVTFATALIIPICRGIEDATGGK